ncbi:hypothetical protein, partial [Bacillus sp. EB600]|uniref:hypothetical protein n=1 Tax=Bacillus sp. EB600 TaxID=2806345 RepID=UPI00210E9960
FRAAAYNDGGGSGWGCKCSYLIAQHSYIAFLSAKKLLFAFLFAYNKSPSAIQLTLNTRLLRSLDLL